jgi:hypothetical protein
MSPRSPVMLNGSVGENNFNEKEFFKIIYSSNVMNKLLKF